MRHPRKGTQHKQRSGSWKEGRPGQRGPEQSGDWWGLSGTEGKVVGSKDRGALSMGGSIASWRAREEASASGNAPNGMAGSLWEAALATEASHR